MKGLPIIALCLSLCFGQAAAAAYFVEAESILDSPQWVNVTAAGSTVSAYVVTEPSASGESGLCVIDGGMASADNFLYYTTAGGTFENGCATAVVRMKVTADVGFSGPWTRNIILSLNRGPKSSRRGVGLAVRPDSAAVTNTLGTQIYGGEIPGDNTRWVVWTIVARDYGYYFDVYRNGVKVVDNASNGSATESAIGGSVGIDALVIASNPAGGTGSWLFDWVAYKSGEDPYWCVPEPGLSTLLGGMIFFFLASAPGGRRRRTL
ncbi:MAG: hypothetical protein QHI38_04265 [Armatimonadota bacterium]|nr:hypothetical protein [Armatimonadota bacterium]